MDEFLMANNIMQQRPHTHLFVMIIFILFCLQTQAFSLKSKQETTTLQLFDGLQPTKLRLQRSINTNTNSNNNNNNSNNNKQLTKFSMNTPTSASTAELADANSNDFTSNKFVAQQQDILYSCPLNTMCQCMGLPNDTSMLVEINCNAVTLYKFPEFVHNSLRYIDMSHTQLQSVDHETFQGLRLKTLKLTDNNIQSISERSFSTMTHSLMTLDISGNKMQNIPFDALQKLHVLTRFVAQRNCITSLDGNWEAQFETLRSLHLTENEITELSSNYANEDANNSTTDTYDKRVGLLMEQYWNSNRFDKSKLTFNKLQKLLWLDLSKNRIFHLTANYLPRSLVTLDISSNLLSTFPAHLFEHLHELRILNLRDNLLKGLQTSKAFKLIHMHLEKLDLGLNLIEHIEKDWWQSNVLKIRLRALNLEKNSITYLPKSVFKGTGIMHLVLAFNELEHIDESAFEGITESLEYLDLEHNHLMHVPRAIRTLKRLKYLYLTSNGIMELTNMPEFTKNLRVLSLSGNNFTHIPLPTLKMYSQLSYLNMGYNSIIDVPENIFAVDRWGANLQTILLRNNKITHLHLGSFNGLDQIQEISLSFNDITIHHPLIFENVSQSLKILELSFALFPTRLADFIDPLESLLPLNQLIWLGLDNNNLKTLANDTLANMRELSYINLAFNQFKCLAKGLFRPEIHSHLVEIDLSYNNLENLEAYSFYKLADLQILNLQANNLQNLKRHAFYKLQFLRSIDLSYNQIHNIAHGAFTLMPNLVELQLQQNNLHFFSLKVFHSVTNITSMLTLNLTQNNLSVFEDELSSYVYIDKLDVSHNHITKALSFSNLASTLRQLNLAYNDINSLNNNAFGNLALLEVLNLAHNNISALRRRSFQGLNNLQQLDLSNNNLDQLQVEQFSNLQKLRILYLNSNRLRALTREVFMNTRLEYLDICDNQLSVWPVPAFSDVGFTLRSIKMSQNEIEYLDSSMFINTQFLIEINIAHNKITVLPDNTFNYLYNLTNLDLSYNPLVTTNLRQILYHTPQLNVLTMRGINMFKLPTFNLLYLSHLDVSANFLQDIFPMHDMRQLRYVNVSHNKFVNASCVIENLPLLSLRILDLANNPIRRITAHDLSNLRHLKELNMQNIKIYNTLAFGKLRSLQKLQLTSYVHIDDIVSRLPGLRELRIHFIDSLLGPQYFSKINNNTKIEILDIYGYNLHNISPLAFQSFANSRKLHLKISHTKISDLPPGLFYTLRKVPQLSIDLSHNKINALAADSFYPNKTFWDTMGTRSIIGGIDITHNPLECECGLVWFGHWLRRWLRESAQIKVIQKDEMKQMIQRARSNTCFDTISGRVLPIMEIFPEDLLCQASALSSSGQKIVTDSLLRIILIVCTIVLFRFRFSLVKLT